MSVNKVILIGNLGRDPEVRYVDKTPVASVSLATTEPAYTAANGTQVAERTEWHTLVMWGPMAERAERYLRKGSKIYAEGKMRYRTWEDRNTIKRTVAEVYVDYFEILTVAKS